MPERLVGLTDHMSGMDERMDELNAREDRLESTWLGMEHETLMALKALESKIERTVKLLQAEIESKVSKEVRCRPVS